MEQDMLVDNLVQELRRGLMTLAVLGQLQEAQYGYSAMKLLADKGLEIDQGTLYPLLRRLESQGLLQSDWRIEETRPRRYYVISERGRKILPVLREEWKKLMETIEPLLMGDPIPGERAAESGSEEDGSH